MKKVLMVTVILLCIASTMFAQKKTKHPSWVIIELEDTL